MSKYLLVVLLLIVQIVTWSCQSQPYQQGEILYNNFCANCHMEDGTGLEGNIPPLAQADYLKNNPLATVCIIRNGMEGPLVVNGLTYQTPMPAVRALSDFEITNVINYINQAWENDYGVVTVAEVREALETCQ